MAEAGVCAPRLPALALLREVEPVLRVHARSEDVEVDAVGLLHHDHVWAHVQEAGARVKAHGVRHGSVAAPEPTAKDEDALAAPNHLMSTSCRACTGARHTLRPRMTWGGAGGGRGRAPCLA